MFNYFDTRQKYIEELEKIPYGEGVLVLPNVTLQNAVKMEHLIKCIGLDSLAMEICNAASGKNYELLTRIAQELIIIKILEANQNNLRYFSNLLNKQGLVQALANLFTEFRRCHVEDAEELARVFENWEENKNGTDADIALLDVPKEKNHDVVLLYNAYLNYLLKHNLYDYEGQYILAIENIDYLDTLGYKKIFISDMPFLNQLQNDFVKALGKKVTIAINQNFDFKKALKEFSLTQKNVHFAKYGNHKDEMLAALSKIKNLLAQGVNPNKIAVVVSDLRSFSGFNRFAEKYQIPITLPKQIKLALQPLFIKTIENLTEQSTVTEFKEQIIEYLDNSKLEEKLGNEYKNGQITLKELQTDLLVKNSLIACANELEKSYKMSGMSDEKISAFAYQNMIRNLASEKNLIISYGTINGITVTEQINAVGKIYDYLFVLGMNDGEFPVPVYDNWIYSDNERALLNSLGFELPLVRERLSKNSLTFFMVLQTCKKKIFFSWMEEDKPAQCTYADELLRLYNTEAEDKRGEIIPYIEDNKISDAAIKTRIESENKRLNGESEYLGNIGKFPQKNPVTYSATELEQFAKCPFAYLLGNVWGIDNYENDEDALSPVDEGNLMHKTLEIFIRNYIKNHQNDKGQALLYSEIADKKDVVQKLLQKEFDLAFIEATNSLSEDIKNNLLLNKQIAKTKLWLDKWFIKEFETNWDEKEFRPVCVENKFDNVELIGRNIKFRGRIDRVDAAFDNDGKANKIKVIDYKRSRTGVPKKEADVQIEVYQKVATLFNKVPPLAENGVLTGSYYNIKDKIKTERILPDNFWETLKNYTTQIADGNFDIRNCKECSAYCPYQTICRKDLLGNEDETDEE